MLFKPLDQSVTSRILVERFSLSKLAIYQIDSTLYPFHGRPFTIRFPLFVIIWLNCKPNQPAVGKE